MPTPSFAVTTVPLDIGALVDTVTTARADRPIGPGAIATFVGVVRDHNAGRRVERLEYEGYEPLAMRSFERIGEEACDQWNARVALHHRLGTLQIGEASVVIAVASPHRSDAFAACRYVIERVKQIAPIWKHEFFEGGDVWIEGATADPDNEDARRDAYRIAIGDQASATSVSPTQPERSGVARNGG